ncbi:hypothetical protein CEXT_647951 [Caerostris extrusa]|uniref:Uncharacterized protein n=1 Tax=Caerostris extrusa TaxID=172846 RepID=A0AAV4PZ20_CAEEX|nr:hypothetical protein CEXT_647951 [Caerostris extrusa]
MAFTFESPSHNLYQWSPSVIHKTYQCTTLSFLPGREQPPIIKQIKDSTAPTSSRRSSEDSLEQQLLIIIWTWQMSLAASWMSGSLNLKPISTFSLWHRSVTDGPIHSDTTTSYCNAFCNLCLEISQLKPMDLVFLNLAVLGCGAQSSSYEAICMLMYSVPCSLLTEHYNATKPLPLFAAKQRGNEGVLFPDVN